MLKSGAAAETRLTPSVDESPRQGTPVVSGDSAPTSSMTPTSTSLPVSRTEGSLGKRHLRVERMGRVAYGPMLALQERRHRQVLEGHSDDTLFLLEHERVITLGKNSSDGHVLRTEDELRAMGVGLFATGRGGDVTYHGPGQIVGYPIVHMQQGERDVRKFVWSLEEILIRTAADFGVVAERVDGKRGIWVGNNKLAAIGVRIARWCTMHGFAINVATNLSDFDLIVPCGLHDCGVTSIERLLGHAVSLREVEDRLVLHAASILGRAAMETYATSLDIGD